MKNTVLILAFLVLFVACGDDNGTKVSEPADDSASSSAVSSSSKTVKSSSSKTVIQSGDSHEESSNSKKSSSSSLRQSSANLSSSSKTVSLNSSSSSKAVIQSGGSHEESSSSSSKIASSSSKIVNLSSSGKNSVLSSSRDYRPYAHDTCLAGNRNYKSSDYKTFVDPRNGRSYYYYTATSNRTGKSITVMAENLNIGEMVLGENNQNDDSKIERYCYNNDTTYCDHYGGLYQWAEMMQLPSRCNTESCAELIQENHRGICPEGWRLFTWDDYVVIRQYKDDFDWGIAGLRAKSFIGYNTSGFSLIGGGLRTAEGGFTRLNEYATWFHPEENEADPVNRARHGIIASMLDDGPGLKSRELKIKGFSVRCTKLVTETVPSSSSSTIK